MPSVKSENTKAKYGYTLEQQICINDKQWITTIVLIYTAILQLTIIKSSRFILFFHDKSLNNSENDLYNLKLNIEKRNDYITKYIITIVIIVAFYFLFQSVDDYEVDKNNGNFNYIIANFFSVIANIIRFITVFGSASINGEEEDVDISSVLSDEKK